MPLSLAVKLFSQKIERTLLLKLNSFVSMRFVRTRLLRNRSTRWQKQASFGVEYSSASKKGEWCTPRCMKFLQGRTNKEG